MSYDIPPFLTYVRSEYLYSLQEGFGYFTPATVFAVSSVSNETLKLHIIADDKVMFTNIPISGLSNSKTAPKLAEEDCVFNLCPDESAVISRFEYLSAVEHCGVWNKNGTFWQKGMYLFSIEWPKAKLQFHFLELEDGNYCLWANERITWGEEIPEVFPEYKSYE